MSCFNSSLYWLSNHCVNNIYVGDDGKLHTVQGGADTALPFKGAVELATQTKSGSQSVKPNSSANLVLTFENLTKISGISSISISGTGNRVITNGISISGNSVTFSFYCYSSGTYTPGVSVTAFEIIE